MCITTIAYSTINRRKFQCISTESINIVLFFALFTVQNTICTKKRGPKGPRISFHSFWLFSIFCCAVESSFNLGVDCLKVCLVSRNCWGQPDFCPEVDKTGNANPWIFLLFFPLKRRLLWGGSEGGRCISLGWQVLKQMVLGRFLIIPEKYSFILQTWI